MRLLLDTHALLWAISAPTKLPKRVAAALRAPANEVYVSPASTWEIAIKAALGKLQGDLVAITDACAAAAFAELPLTVRHTLALRDLDPHHRDPFDRILVAQALAESLTLVTHDAALRSYPAPIFW